MIFESVMRLGKSLPLRSVMLSINIFHNHRFGRQYLMLQKGSENLRSAKSREFQPDLRKHNKKEFHLEYVSMKFLIMFN